MLYRKETKAMKIKVMTFNLRCPVRKDGINEFENRKKKILATIEAESPDLIGFQEAIECSRDFLKRSLTDYVVLGCGREENYHGESCVIAFRRDLFDLISYETKWLSLTPSVTNSRYEGTDQSSCPRHYLHAELVFGDEGKRLHFYNTHLDHKGEIARLLGMTQIMQSIESCDAPFVLVGDMNATPNDSVVQIPLLSKSRRIADATASVTHTFNGFGQYESGVKIDYIYTDIPFSDTYAVEDPHEDGVYISDHFAVCTTIEI